MAVAAGALRGTVAAITARAGAEPWAAGAVAQSLVQAHLVGHESHGVQLLPIWIELALCGDLDLNGEPQTVDDHGAVVRIEGNRALGPVVGRHACNTAVKRAREHGVSCVLARNANHLGRLGEFTETVAHAGQIAILLSNCQGAGQLMTPPGRTERRLTNNPISVATPGSPHPVVLDMALSAAAEAKVLRALSRGEDVPPGWILDRDGNPSTDPRDLFEAGGLLAPLGAPVAGHKGIGLSIVVDLIAGILTGGGVCRAGAGPFFNTIALLAIDVDPLVPAATFDANVALLAGHLRTGCEVPHEADAVMPGERAARIRARRMSTGIPLDEVDLQALKRARTLANTLGERRV